MDSVHDAIRPMSLDERAVALCCAINVDIDYFSRHSGQYVFSFGKSYNLVVDS